MIFPKLECDVVVQVNDKFRINAVKTYISKDEDPITKVEIEPEAGAGFIEVQGLPVSSKNFWLDWEYQTAGDKVISLRVTTETVGPTEVTITKTITCLTELEDKLFSQDSDLVGIQSDILKYVPDGRASFKYIHREAQKEILEWFYHNGFNLYDGSKITKANVIDTIELNFWSKYMALRLIYEDLSNAVDDIFDKKAKEYENDEKEWRHKYRVKLDLDGNGEANEFETLDLVSREFKRV